MVPDGVVTDMREQVGKGKTTPEKAGLKLAAACPCGIFNQKRAEELLRLEIGRSDSED